MFWVIWDKMGTAATCKPTAASSTCGLLPLNFFNGRFLKEKIKLLILMIGFCFLIQHCFCFSWMDEEVLLDKQV